MGYGDLIDAFLKVRNSLSNLSKDVDERDPREKTDQDLNNLTGNFQELITLFQSMEASDLQKIYQEVMELSSGQETFQEYIRDVNQILTDVRKRAQKNDATREKIEQNLPQHLQDEDIDSLLAQYQDTVKRISNWQKNVGSQTASRR
jgi:DNA repair exonuclease SbcCD ATPase subunit